MSEKRPVIAVAGLEQYKNDMEVIQEKLTKQGCIVIPIGTYGPESLDFKTDSCKSKGGNLCI